MALYAPIPSWAEDQPELNSSAVMKRDIPWDTYTSARLISDKDLQNIRMYDKAPAKTQEDVLATVRLVGGWETIDRGLAGMQPPT